MRSLFDDTKNPVFRLLCQIVKEIATGARLTRKEILDRIFSLPEFIYLEAPESEREKEIVDTLFNFDDKGFATIFAGKNFSLPISDTELFWLSAVLNNDEFLFLLPAELRNKLSARLKNFPPLHEKNFWRKLHATQKKFADKNFSDKLSIIISALRQRKKIISDGKILTPCRLEYDLFTDKFFLIIWQEDEQCAEKLSVEIFNSVTVSEKFSPPDIEDCLKKFYTENIATVSLKVQNTRNAVERCFALFSSFDKKSRVQDDTYFLTINYCTLDEEEIFDKVFSLGAAVTVIEPKNFRERLIKKFTAIKNLYN